jgi:hypothetical protein
MNLIRCLPMMAGRFQPFCQLIVRHLRKEKTTDSVPLGQSVYILVFQESDAADAGAGHRKK